MSIRTRLTITFTCLFGLIVLGLAIGSYVLVRNSLFSAFNTQLQVAVDSTAMSAEHELNEHQTAAAGERDLQAVLDERHDHSASESQILVLQGSRQVAYKNGAVGMIDLRRIPPERLRDKEVNNMRVAADDLPVAKFKSQYQIFAAASPAQVKSRLTRFAWILALLVPAGLILAGSAGYFLAKASLAPLNELSTTIDSVTSSELGRRVAVTEGDDEISSIAWRFNSLLNRLQHAFDSQQRFMADASHELRTPFTVALAAAQVTARDPARTLGDCDEALHLIEGQMLRVKNIVQQLLLLSQADASALRVNLEDVYLDDVVSDAARAARSLVRTKQQRLEVGILPESRVRGDSDLLGQVVMILLDNAIKFTPPDGTISVGVDRCGEYWVCYVSDTGIGISESAQERIFDRFYRGVNDKSDEEVKGSGLGLAIAKALIESHGGRLKVAESRPGFTRFEIALLALDKQVSGAAGSNQANSFAVKI